jgi:CitB family two-component system sensor histidine kinase MalK
VALALLSANFLITRSTTIEVEANIGKNATNIARILARSPIIIEGLSGERDEKEIQHYAEEMRKATNVEFIVVMDMRGFRKSHPDVSKIGQHFVGGDEGAVLDEGREYTSVAEGTLGPSLRAFTPVKTVDGRQIGAVSVGVLLDHVDIATAKSRTMIYLATGFGLLLGILGAVALAREVKQTLFGLEPFAIARLLEERSAMLQSVREGILAVDRHCRVTLINREAERIFQLAGIQGDLIGKEVNEYVPSSRLKEVIETGCVELDQEQDINGVAILTNRIPVKVDGQIVGAIATFRDKTEIRRLAEQLIGIRNYAEALRAQAHEFMNKLQVILGMVQMECYDQIAGYVSSVARQHRTEVNFAVRRIKDPIFAGFILGKMSYARERGVELTVSPESFLPNTADPEMTHELITIAGNLIDNALEAVENRPNKKVKVQFSYQAAIVILQITDTGSGMTQEQQEQMFTKGYSTKANDRGLGLFLVRRSIDKLGGGIEVVSEIDKGTTFIVRLPYERGGEAE